MFLIIIKIKVVRREKCYYFSEEIASNNRCNELFLDHENAGCDDILIAARKIMADKKVCDV